MNTCRIVLVICLALIVWLSSALVRVENERYAMSLGMCPQDVVLKVPDLSCVKKTQTRTTWIAHIYYALNPDVPGNGR